MINPCPENNDPEVSVLITTYNVSNYVRQAVDSILHQTLERFELIIIDDGSTDDTGKILDEYAQRDERVHVWHQANEGRYPTLNKGLELCNGKYIAIMDGDDIAMPHRLEAQLRYLSMHAELTVVAGSIQAISEAGKEIGYWVWPSDCNDVRNMMLTTMCIFLPAVMVRKEAILKMGGFPAEVRSGQDNVLWVDMIIAGYRIGNVPEVVLKWRAGRTGSITATRGLQQRLEVLRCRSRLVSFARSSDGWLSPDIEDEIQKAFPGGGSPLDNKPFQPGSLEFIDPIGKPAQRGDLESCIRAWLVGKDESAQLNLTDELRANGHQLLANLVNRATDDEIRELYLNAFNKNNDVKTKSIDKESITIILPWSDDLDDLEQRINSIQYSTKTVDEILVIVPSPSQEKLVRTLIEGLLYITIICMDDVLGKNLARARTMARGTVIGYLFPCHRFDPDFLSSGAGIIASGKYQLVFANRLDLYPDVSMEGNQLSDALIPFPGDRSSVLGQEGRKPLGYLENERVYLSGFMHAKEGDWDCLIPLNETVPEHDWIVAMDWAYRLPFAVLPICNMHIRKNYHFENRLWKAFLRATIQPYLESAFGLLDDKSTNHSYREVGKTLDALWRNGYPIYLKNRQQIFSTFVINVPAPWRFSVFRELCAWDIRRNFASAVELGGLQGGLRTLVAWALSLASRVYRKFF